MIPSNLKIGDTYTEESVDRKVFMSKIIGFDEQGRYISEFIGLVTPEQAKEAEVEEKITEKVVKDYEITEETVTPIEQLLAEEAPKKVPARKPATRKRSTKKK